MEERHGTRDRSRVEVAADQNWQWYVLVQSVLLSEVGASFEDIGGLCKLDVVFLRVEVKVEVAGNDALARPNVLKETEHCLVVLAVYSIVVHFGQVIQINKFGVE